MRVLVTGGAGFIGSFVVDRLVERGHQVRVFDALVNPVHADSRTPPAYLNRAAEFIAGDVRDADALEKALAGIDAVVHNAALVGVGQSQYRIAPYMSANVDGTATLFDLIVNRRTRVNRIVVAGSMSSYGEGEARCPEHGVFSPSARTEAQLQQRKWEICCPLCGEPSVPVPTSENRVLNPLSVYALSKKVQEELALTVGRTFGLPVTVARLFNVYGPRQSLNNPYTGIMAIFMSRLLNGGRPTIYEDGRQLRDFVYVGDVANAFVKLLEAPPAEPTVVNIGTGKPTSVLELAQLLIDHAAPDRQAEILGRYRRGDIRHCYADVAQARRLGIEVKTAPHAAIPEIAAWAASLSSTDQFSTAQRELIEHGLLV